MFGRKKKKDGKDNRPGSTSSADGEGKLKSEKDINEMLNRMCADRNITGAAKDRIINQPLSMKKEMAISYQKSLAVKTGSASKAEDPEKLVEDMAKAILSKNEKQIKEKISEVASLLRSKDLTWVRKFSDEGGLNALCSILDYVFQSQDVDLVIHVIRDSVAAMKGLMNNKYGLEEIISCQDNKALRSLAMTISYQSIQVVPIVLDLMSAMCLFSTKSYALVLDAMSHLSKRLKEPARFFVFARMMKETTTSLVDQINGDGDDNLSAQFCSSAVILLTSCVTFINQLLGVDDFELRMHLRCEFINLAIDPLFENLLDISDHELFIGKEGKGDFLVEEIEKYQFYEKDDIKELADKFDVEEIDLSNRDELFQILKKSAEKNDGSKYFLSILQYLMLVRDDHSVRPKYYRLIGDVMSQVALQREENNDDICGFNFNVSEMIESYMDKERLIEMKESVKEMTRTLENIIKQKGDTKKDLENTMKVLMEEKKKIEEEFKKGELEYDKVKQDKEEQLKEGSEKIKTLAEQVAKETKDVEDLKEKLRKSGLTVDWGTVPASSVAPAGAPPGPGGLAPVTGGPPPPPPPGGGPPPPPPPPMAGGPPPPPPPPPPGGGPPPPPPPPPGVGPPPPPPPPGGGPPPPPPPPGGGPPPPPGGPPPPPGAPGIARGPVKKVWAPNQQMKKVNWSQLPQAKIKDTFWAKVDETKWTTLVTFTDLEEQFSVKKPKPKVVDIDGDAPKKVEKKQEVVLIDGKKAYNLAIFLGRLKKTAEELRINFLKVDDEQYDEQILTTFEKFKADPDELGALKGYEGPYEDLSAGDKFTYTMSLKITRYPQRLTCMIFRVRYQELFEEFSKDAKCVLMASRELKNSSKFTKLLEVVLLLGNYMNSSIKSAGPVHGFKLDFLNKLQNTKTADNKANLLNFLVDLVDEKFPELSDWYEEIMNVIPASRVDIQSLDSTKRELEKGLKAIEDELPHHKTDDANDNFAAVLGDFHKDAKTNTNNAIVEFEDGQAKFTELLKFFAEDPKKMSTDEFFTIFKTFINSFKLARKQNTEKKEKAAKEAKKLKDQEERKRKQEEKRKAKEEASKKALGSGDGEGVMDNLLSSLRSGQAFQREPGTAPRRERRQRAEPKPDEE